MALRRNAALSPHPSSPNNGTFHPAHGALLLDTFPHNQRIPRKNSPHRTRFIMHLTVTTSPVRRPPKSRGACFACTLQWRLNEGAPRLAGTKVICENSKSPITTNVVVSGPNIGPTQQHVLVEAAEPLETGTRHASRPNTHPRLSTTKTHTSAYRATTHTHVIRTRRSLKYSRSSSN
jgi:hypothetical protein